MSGYKIKDIVGHKFGSREIISRGDNSKCGSVRWLMRCECGKEGYATTASLNRVIYPKCMSCARKEHDGRGTQLYNSWHALRVRANGTGNAYNRLAYAHVDVCDEWSDFIVFKEWAMNNGYKEGLSIDRIDNAKGYHPNNCRWATPSMQVRNRGVTKLNEEAVKVIRYCRNVLGYKLKRIGHAYGIDTSYVSAIAMNKVWKESI